MPGPEAGQAPACGPRRAGSSCLGLKLPLPLTPFTPSVFWAKVITEKATASDIWSMAVTFTLAIVSHAWW